ncbi:hypothetical protein DFH29DRAFT_1005108 [Suillus ampliporus]|nr:hypothetical protein DFH29DRAFT_1005108 [Suillus ampliporus]
MSTPVDTSFTGLKATTAQIMGIISGARQIPPGPSHLALTAQVGSLVADVVKEYGTSPHIPGLVLSCSKELIRVRTMTPQVWPNWHSIGYDDPCLLKHSWRSKIIAWEVLGDHTFDLPVAAPPSIGPIPVDLPSPPVVTSNVPGSSTNPTTEYRDKGKGKAVVADPEPEAEGSRKRKSPMIPAVSSQPPKLAMKSHKCMRSTHIVKSKAFVELEDDDEPIIKPFSCGVLEVVLPQVSTILARTPNSPCSPWVPTKKPFSPATAISGSRPAVVKPSQPTPDSTVEAPPVIEAGDILIPRPVKQPMPGLQQARLALRNSVRQEDRKPMHVVCLLLDKEDQVHLGDSGIPAHMLSSSLYHPEGESRGLSGTLAVTAVTTPKTQTHGCSKTITAIKAPAPAPAPLLSSSSAVPHAALNVPMLDLHGMAIAIQDAAARIAILEARVVEQDGKFDTLQCLHEGLRREIVDRHPSFPLPDLPANATSLLFDQSVPMDGAHTPKFKDASAIEGLLFESNEVVHPEGPHTSGKNVDPGDPGNLVPEYDSDDDMDVEVKLEVKLEETDMAT